MKKTFLKFGALIVAGSVFVGCSKDDDEVKTTEPEFPTEYSELTVEQNKSNLEDNGISLINEMEALKDASGIQTTIAFTGHLDGSTLPENIGGRVNNNTGIRLMKALGAFGGGKTSTTRTLESLRTTAEDFESFKAAFNDLAGTFIYSKANDTWTYTAGGDKIIFQFPSTETGTTNDAQYTIYGLETVTINSNLGGDDYNGDYPTALKAELTVNGNKKMEYSFSASYNNSGDPSALKIALTIDAYTLAYEVSNSTSEAKFDYTLKNGDKMLFGYGARAKGDFSSTAVNNSDNTSDVITEGSAYFQIMNIKFSGEANFKALYDGLQSATTIEQELKAMNDNYKLLVFYDDSKKKIADSEFYITEEEYTEWKEVWNEEMEWYDWVEVTETREVIEIRLVFADGTKSDMATYTDVGFDDLQSQLETFMDDLN